VDIEVFYTVPGLFVPKTFRSQERIVPMGNIRSETFRGNFRSKDFSFSGTFVPPTILQSISYEPQTAIYYRPICFTKIN